LSYIVKDCFEKSELLQHRWQGQQNAEYSSWRPCFHKSCLTWASQM
jgi:hypothetical protein